VIDDLWNELAKRWAPSLTVPAQRAEESDQQPERAAMADEDLPFQSGNEAWEESVDDAVDSSGAPRTGVMVAFFPTIEQARELAIDDGEPEEEIHLTLAFLGEVGAELTDEDEAHVVGAVTAWARTQGPITASTNGLGLFFTPDPVTYANVDSPDLPAARQRLVEYLDRAGVAPLQTHGYTPHMTLDYGDRRDINPAQVTMTFTTVTVAWAGNRIQIPLAQSTSGERAYQDKWPGTAHEVAAGGPVFNFYTSPAATTSGSITSGSNLQWNATPATATTMTTPAPEQGRAFTTEINGRQLIAGPATAIQRAAGLREPTVEDIADEHMMWMSGRFVGAEVPNRNGAMWSAGDLELGRASVVNGPLNWLHEAKHVIGAISEADYVGVQQAAASQMQPHITATAGIWKWLWPDEAYVVQQASDQQHLWYSMECISKEVQCAGPEGCGNVTSYSQYMAGAACEHVTQRASVRQFKNPVFLGGAVIVPPVKPGWAEADASVMNTASRLAEAAFEQAGEPDVSATLWEQMMAQLVIYTQR
jgi:2'-5' RNA ligase